MVRMFSDIIQYEFKKPWTIDLQSENKQVMVRTCMRRELIDFVEGKIKLTKFDENPRIKRTNNKLAGITEMVLNLDELDNTNNLGNGKPGNTFLHMM